MTIPSSTAPNTSTDSTNDNPRTQNGWAFYDWANSSYALVINTALFPLYYQSIMTGNPPVFNWFGHTINANAAYSFSLTLSFLILVFLSPALSSIAGSRGNKLSFLKTFCLIGSLSCMGLFFFKTPAQLPFALLLNICASIGFYGSLVFYNAFLPEVAPTDKQDALSARGFALGYVGSLLMLIVSLVLVQVIANDDNRGLYTRLCFFLTGCWWLGFAQYSFARLPKNRVWSAQEQTVHHTQSTADLFADSYAELSRTMRNLTQNRQIKWFLSAFFFYSVGMQTIFLIATFIGTEIHLSASKMILTIMMLQIEAVAGALGFAWLVKRIGNTVGLIGAVLMWIGICLLIYYIARLSSNSVLNLEIPFFIAAGMVGMVMGGLQSVSRSTYSKLLPANQDSATFFGFYDVLEKLSIVTGTLVNGLLINLTGKTQNTALALAGFFAIALYCLSRLKQHESSNK